MNTPWGSEDDAEFEEDLVHDIGHLVPTSERNLGDIGTRDFYDRQDRMAREIVERPRWK